MSARQLNAAEIARALGGKREGRQWRCPCPAHRGHSLLLADGRNGKLLATCFGGCQWKDIFGKLRALGLMGKIASTLGASNRKNADTAAKSRKQGPKSSGSGGAFALRVFSMDERARYQDRMPKPIYVHAG